jgi:hypothetical protein
MIRWSTKARQAVEVQQMVNDVVWWAAQQNNAPATVSCQWTRQQRPFVVNNRILYWHTGTNKMSHVS